MIDSIIFDFDGVIVDSVDIKTEAFVTLYGAYPDCIKNKVRLHHLENAGISRYKKIYFYQKSLIQEDCSEDTINQLAQKFSDIVVEKVIDSKYVPGAYEFIKNNHEKIDLHIATGTPQGEIELILTKRNIVQFFKSIYGTPLSKTEIIRKVLKKYNYNENKVLFIGDAMSDYIGANNNNIRFLGRVESGADSIFPIDQIIVNDLHKLKDFLKTL